MNKHKPKAAKVPAPEEAQPKLAGTAFAWASALGIDWKTLVTRIKKADLAYMPDKEFSAREILLAMTSDKETAMTRKLEAETEKLKREEKTAEGQLLSVPDVERAIWQGWLLPLKLELEQMPQKLAALILPEEPSRPLKVLTDWVESTKKLLREK